MKIDRVYSTMKIKAIDEEAREITGIASTPSTDRMGDIVLPEGAVFKLPLPLLWQHDSMQPIGEVIKAKVTKQGIEITARLVQVASPSQLAARLEEAWQCLKTGLVRGLSIGFSPLKWNYLDNGGYEFIEWGWHELSAVTIPANAEASITSIKSFDSSFLAASGKKKNLVVRLNNHVGASTKNNIPKVKPVEGDNMTIEEQIKAFQASRAEKTLRMNAIVVKAGEEGRSLDASEEEEYDNAEAEVKSFDSHLKRLQGLAAINAANLTPVDATTKSNNASNTRMPAVAKVTEKLEKGIEFARYAMCLGAAKGDLSTASAIAQKRFPHSEKLNITLKAAVDAGTTTDPTWAAPLVEYNDFAGDFVDFLRPQTILGRFGQGGIPALRSIPFNVHIKGQTSGGAGYWVGQAQAKPVTKFDFNDVYLGFAKVANIAVLTDELVRFSNPSAERLVRDSLAEALIGRLDTDFIDPNKVAVANVSPASITNGVTPIVSSGSDPESIRLDVKAAMGKFIAANVTPTAGVWIMSATTALSLSLMRNTLGQKEFDGITMLGGTFEGLPVIVSQYVPSTVVILVNASDVWLADDGQVVIDASREASLQMLDNPTNSSNDATATTLVSMFQTNSIAIRAERWINWQKRRASAVAYITGVNWGDESSS